MISPYVMPGIVRPTTTRVMMMAEETCRQFGTTLPMVRSRKKKTNIVMARHTIATLANLGFGFPLIAAACLVNRSHCNVINSKRVVSESYQTDKDFKEKLNQIMNYCNINANL